MIYFIYTQKPAVKKEKAKVEQKQPAAKKPQKAQKNTAKPIVKEEEEEEEEEKEEEEEEEEEEEKVPRSRCIKECELLIFQIYRLLGGLVCGC